MKGVKTRGRAEVLVNMTDTVLFDGRRPDLCPVCGSRAVARGAGGTPCPECGHLLWFAANRIDGVTVIHVLDTKVAVMELLELLDNAVAVGLMDRIVLNLGMIQQVSSAALGKLIKLSGRAGEVRGRLRLCCVHTDLRHVLRITRLDRVFDIDETEAESVAAFAAGG